MASTHWRIRIFNTQGSCVEGGFLTQDAAAARQTELNAVYAAHPERRCLTVLETYTPTRPALDKVRALLTHLREQIDEIDASGTRQQGLSPTWPLRVLYEGLIDAAQMLAQIVSEEEGHPCIA